VVFRSGLATRQASKKGDDAQPVLTHYEYRIPQNEKSRQAASQNDSPKRKSVQKTATAPPHSTWPHTRNKNLMSRRVNPRQTMDRWEAGALCRIRAYPDPYGLGSHEES
jgi:hypothetical protein